MNIYFNLKIIKITFHFCLGCRMPDRILVCFCHNENAV